MSELCRDRTVIVTGAGNGLGKCYALALAEAGAYVVVNDINEQTARDTVSEINNAGGAAKVNTADITDHKDAKQIVDDAIQSYGDIHAVVNNAGICRDRMFASLNPEEWDAVISVHLKGHYCIANQAAKHWRSKSKEGLAVSGRIINTSSGAGLLGSVGQSNYSAAKGGILTLTLVQAAELARYGVTANALAPQARTGMTEEVFAEMMKIPEDGSFDQYNPANVAPLVVWLVSDASSHVTGQCFELFGGKLSIAEGWRTGPTEDIGERWKSDEIGSAVDRLMANSREAQPVYGV